MSKPAEEPDQVDDVQAMDSLGNPLCPGCYASAWDYAARSNSGLSACYCPTVPRSIEPVETRAEALLRIIEAFDQLDRLGHAFGCDCLACQARRTLSVAS